MTFKTLVVISPEFKDGGGSVNLIKLLSTLENCCGYSVKIYFITHFRNSIYKIPNGIEIVNIDLSKPSIRSIINLYLFVTKLNPDQRNLLICNGRGGGFYGIFISLLFSKTLHIPRGVQSSFLSDKLIVHALNVLSRNILFLPVSKSENIELSRIVPNCIKTKVVRNPVEIFQEIADYKNAGAVVWVGRASYEKRVNDLYSFSSRYLAQFEEKMALFFSNADESVLIKFKEHSVLNNQNFVSNWGCGPSILLSFSEREGFPTTVAEAICFGMIPVLTRIPAHLEAVSFALTFAVGDVNRCLCLIRRVKTLIGAGRLVKLRGFVKLEPSEFSYEIYRNEWLAILRDNSYV